MTMSKPSLALFDLDHTLLPLDSDYHWADFLARNGHVGDPQEALRLNDELMQRYEAGNLSADESFAFMLGLIADRPLDQLEQWQAEYMETIIEPAITEQAQALVERHRQRSEEHTSELQSRGHLVCRLLLEKKKNKLRA